MSDDVTIRPEDALQVAQRALQKINELEADLEAERQRVDELEQDVQRLSARVTADDSTYADLDRDARVGRVREHLINRAQSHGGRAALDCNGIMWEVFDGEPSRGYCYKLMELAAQGSGYGVRNPEHGNKQVTVDLDAVTPETGLSRVTTTTPGEGA